jgi:hypothetical protein
MRDARDWVLWFSCLLFVRCVVSFFYDSLSCDENVGNYRIKLLFNFLALCIAKLTAVWLLKKISAFTRKRVCIIVFRIAFRLAKQLKIPAHGRTKKVHDNSVLRILLSTQMLGDT